MGALDPVRRLVPRAWKVAIKRAFGRPLTRLQPDWQILECIGPVDRPHVVFDVGCHEGWFFHSWKDWCPAAEIHAFDAAEEAIRTSERLYGSTPGLALNNVGVGSAPGELEFHLFEGSPVSSSFLRPVEETWKAIDYHTGPLTTRRVPVVTLDSYARDRGIAAVYLLKIDVQGFEMEVLRGAAETLKNTDHVFVEAAIRPLYEGAPRFTDVYRFMDAAGFHLIAMRAWHRGNLALVETDMLFRRNDLMPPIDPTVEKVMVRV